MALDEVRTAAIELLPDCRLTTPKRTTRIVNKLGSINYTPLFCANCGADGGMVPEYVPQVQGYNFAFYLCDPCAEKWSALAGTMLIPDQAYWLKLREMQMSDYGHELTSEEVVIELQNPTSKLSRFVSERRDK